jgi:hypothetical protein
VQYSCKTELRVDGQAEVHVSSGQQPRNQPTPRRTKFGDGTCLAGVGVALGFVLGFVLKTKNALRWGWGLGLFRASSQCNQGGPKSQERAERWARWTRTYIHNTDTEEHAVGL